MAEIVLIDEITGQDESDVYNTYYIRLAVDENSQLGLGVFVPNSITVEEGFGRSNVTCKVVLTDTIGALVNAKTIEGSDLFTLYIGRNPENFQQYKLRMKACRIYNESMGESANYQVELILISDHWQKMSHDRSTQHWRNSFYSDVVSDIVSDCGIDNYYVSKTKKTQRTIIKPYWTNEEMLKWASERSQGDDGDTFFVYAALADGMFFYTTFSDLIDNAVPNIFEFTPSDPREFTLSGEGSSTSDRRRISNFRVQSDYVDELSAGASGVKYGYYDYDTRTYVKGTHTFSDSEERQLSDWGMVSESQETAGMFYFGYRDKELTENVVKSTVSKENNKILDVMATTQGTTDVQVGELIKIIIPVNPDFLNTQFNEFYSGRYVVSYKKTMCNLQTSAAETVFKFTRQGINGTAVNTLTQSKKGKV